MTRFPTLLLAAILSAQAGGSAAMIDFSTPGEEERWYAVNDGVMGGVSRGGLTVEEGVGVFSGSVSFENDGGFSSVWRRPARYELAGTEALRVRVRGDGKTYRVRLTTPGLPDGVSYQLPIETTAGTWTDHELPYEAFEPRFRGRRVNAPPLDPTKIREVGLLIADGQEGPFRLELEGFRAR